MNISIICAKSSKNIIGDKKRIPWLIKEDLQYFKYITIGKVVIMGRITYESIGKYLNYRKNIVLTKKKSFHAKNCVSTYSVKESIKLIFPYKNCLVIGGSQIYNKYYNYCNYLYVTEVCGEFKGNIHFHNIKYKEWVLIDIIFRAEYIYKIYKRKTTYGDITIK